MNQRLVTVTMLLLGSCGPAEPAEHPPAVSREEAPRAHSPAAPPSPAKDVEARATSEFLRVLMFLKQHGEVEVLEADHGAKVVVSPKYQGRVMTSAVNDLGGSLGWVNENFIESGKTGTQFDNYGGEDRFWLGPEAGQFGLYFPKGKPFEFAHWQTPSAFQEGTWAVAERQAGRVAFERTFELDNYQGTRFELMVKRDISLLDRGEITSILGVEVPEGVEWVAYQSTNEVKNLGKRPWTQRGGLISIWILAMFPPAEDTWAIVPFERRAKGPIVNDEYFGKVPADRLVIDEALGVLFFRCDGQLRSKIGLAQGRAKPVLGSYSASRRQLTVVSYQPPAKPAPYVNSMWRQQKEPYRGDVVNSYNDGPTEPGKPALGGFYELETSSPGAELAPEKSMLHEHRTFHFVGDGEALEPIARAIFGVPLSALPQGSPAPAAPRN